MAGDQVLDRKVVPGARGAALGRKLLLVGGIAIAGAAVAAAPVPKPGPFQKGMVLGIFSRNAPEYFRTSVGELRDLGVNSISLIVPKVQKNVRSTGLYDDPWITPGDPSLRLAAREAHRQGMTVFLFPIVYVDQLGDGEWRGTLAPASWDEWFRAYDEMVLHYARLAAEERIEFFSVGSELCSTEGFRARWKDLIRKVRRAYPGKITYSANWDHLDPVSFGSELDFLGMNAYYEVGKGDSPDIDSMVTRWREIQRSVRAWREANGGKPLVITEVGYPSRTGASRDPWNYFGEGEPDEEEQRKCYEAFVRAWKGETMLTGVYFYLWWGQGGAGDKDYTPKGKSAEAVVRAWYGVGDAGGGLQGSGGVMP